MKTIEKVFIYIIIGSFLCTLLFSHWFVIPLFTTTSILSLLYIFIGNKLFEIPDNKILKIVAGVIFGLGLCTLLFSLKTPIRPIHKGFVILNIVFCIYLISGWMLNTSFRKKGYNKLVLRSITISCISGFFAFSSIYNTPYRTIIKSFCDSDYLMYYNLLMFDEIGRYQDFMGYKDFDNAIISAKEAIINGKKWRDYDKEAYEDFGGTYEFLAKAFEQQGHKLYDDNKYKLALDNYYKADSVFSHQEHIAKFPEATKEDIYWNTFNILKTFNRLGDDINYDKTFNSLIERYFTVKDSIDLDYYYILENAAINSYTRGFYIEAIKINKSAEKILKRDSINNLDNFKGLYNRQFTNYYLTDSLDQAKHTLDNYKKTSSEKDCKYLYNYTRLLRKTAVSKALIFAKKCSLCFNQEDNLNNIFNAKLLIAIIELENSNFKNFEEQMEIAKPLAWSTDNPEAHLATINQTLGYHNFLKGDYLKSREEYNKAISYFINKSKDSLDIKSQNLRLKIALIDKELIPNYDASTVNKTELEFLSLYDNINPSFTSIHNDLGNINAFSNTKLSDSLFTITLKTHKKYNIKHSPKIAIAKNGLAINQLSLKHYKKSDSLFLEAIVTFNHHYGENKNINQLISYINIATSKFEQADFVSSINYLQKAKLTRQKCFENEQTLYDLYIFELEGDLSRNHGFKKTEANATYKKALQIATKFLPENHFHIKNLVSKIDK